MERAYKKSFDKKSTVVYYSFTMEQTLSYVIVTPYTIAKSRTGGVIARLLSRADLEFVGVQMIVPDEDFVHDYAESLRESQKQNINSAGELLAGYVERKLSPSGGRRHRFLLLVFRGEDACKKLSDICGALFPKDYAAPIYGTTIRDTYADFIVDDKDHNKIVYFEPAILTPRKQELADRNMEIFVRHIKNIDNIVQNISYPDPLKIEQTLVIIKPDNWYHASTKPGNIIDMFSRAGLRIVGTKVFHFSLNQAMDFYGPVESALKERVAPIFGQKAREFLESNFNFSFGDEAGNIIAECFGREYAREQFRKIVEYMSGRRPDTCKPGDEEKPGEVKCMILIYEGEGAVKKIRDVLGPTDPLKAPDGTVRREFGHSVMENTAHASDSVESCEREKKIVRINENPMVSIMEEYLNGLKR